MYRQSKGMANACREYCSSLLVWLNLYLSLNNSTKGYGSPIVYYDLCKKFWKRNASSFHGFMKKTTIDLTWKIHIIMNRTYLVWSSYDIINRNVLHTFLDYIISELFSLKSFHVYGNFLVVIRSFLIST